MTSATITRAALAAGLLTLAGCAPQSATVSGKVTFDGRPVPFGSVSFVTTDGKTATGSITEGQYKVEKVPAGLVQVAVTVLPPPPTVVRPDAEPSGKPDKILKPTDVPERYKDHTRSGLWFEVTRPVQEFDITLKPQ